LIRANEDKAIFRLISENILSGIDDEERRSEVKQRLFGDRKTVSRTELEDYIIQKRLKNSENSNNSIQFGA
jgi:hypothetical protein